MPLRFRRPAPPRSAFSRLSRLSAAALLALLLFGGKGAGAADREGNRYGLNLLFTGLTYHPDGGENEDYPRKLDEEAYFVVQLGGEVHADYNLKPWLAGRFATSLYRDCADVWAGFFHLGPRLVLDRGWPVVFRIGIGPTWLWRENWLGVVDGYTRDSFFGKATAGTFQHRVIWHGGNIDLEYRLGPRWSLLYSNVPGWPEVITSALGARYRF